MGEQAEPQTTQLVMATSPQGCLQPENDLEYRLTAPRLIFEPEVATMKNAFFVSLSLLFLAGYAGAQDNQGAQPNAPAPAQPPPPPPQEPPPPPAEAQNVEPDQNQPAEVVASQPQQPPSSGQWVYTTQYGWVWMPYGAQYVYEPTYEGAYPYSYVYYPANGWIWLSSPWVWGWGPWPYFGVYGPRFFVWYSHPGFYGRFGFGHRAPVFHRGWGYRGWGGGGHWGRGNQGGGGWTRGYQGGGFRGGGAYHQSVAPGLHAGGGGFHRSAPPGGHTGGGFGRGGGGFGRGGGGGHHR
jgi:hypothetical protein